MANIAISSAVLTALIAFSPRAYAHFDGTGIGPLLQGATHGLSLVGFSAVIALGTWCGLGGKGQARRALLVLIIAWIIGTILADMLQPADQYNYLYLCSVVTGAFLFFGVSPSSKNSVILAKIVGFLIGWSASGSTVGMSEKAGVLLVIGGVALHAMILGSSLALRKLTFLIRLIGIVAVLIPALAPIFL